MEKITQTDEAGVYTVRLTMQEIYLIRDGLFTEKAQVLQHLIDSFKKTQTVSMLAEQRVHDICDLAQVFVDHVSQPGV